MNQTHKITQSVLSVFLFVLATICIAETTFTGSTIIDTSSWLHEKTVGSSTVTERFGKLARYTHTTGTNDNQMSDVVVVSGTLTNSQSVTHALSTLSNSFGDTVNFTTVKALAIFSTTGDLTVGNASADQFSSWLGATNQTVKIASGGMLMFVAPLAGFSSSSTNLKIENTTTNTATYQLYIGGIQ